MRRIVAWVGAVTIAIGAAGCRGETAPSASTEERVLRDLAVLTDDSLAGRRTGTPGARSASAYIADQLEAAGTVPAGDSGYFQTVPFVRTEGGRLRVAESWAAFRAAAPEERFTDRNVVSLVPGKDGARAEEAVVVGAHYDHVGIRRPVDGDSIYNGADDDASGVVAVLEIARAVVAAGAYARTIVFLVTTGEEEGLLGTRWYAAHPVVPLAATVAQLQVEMIGRPDTAVGGPGRVWLTGYERSTVGPALAGAGLPIQPDPRPDQQFFRRSDNYVFALQGVPAHTVSSFGLHGDYHRPTDEIDRIDAAHLTSVIETLVQAVRVLAEGRAPRWEEGMRPVSR